MARVLLNDVTKIYPGDVKAVDRATLEIGQGEFVVLVGPSGCGKSTTLRMVAGLEEISGGTISIGDRVVNDVAPKDRDIAMVFQNYALYPHMTVYKNMAFGLKLRRFPKLEIDQRVRDAARVLDIEHLLDRKPKALSGGQRQRVAVGRAIVRDPAVFLFDEPLSNLDAKLRVTTRAELKRLHQRLKTTTIYVTHDQEEAMTLGDRIVVMKDGLIQQAESPLLMYQKPANRFVAGFIGMPPMDFFHGRLVEDAGQLMFEEGQLTNVRSTGDENDPDRPNLLEGDLSVPGDGFKVALPARFQQAAQGRIGEHLVLGVRPEHFSLSPSGTSGGIEAVIGVIEPLGSDMDTYFSTKYHKKPVARVPAQRGVEADQRMALVPDLDRAHLFEPGETGANLTFDAPETTGGTETPVAVPVGMMQ
ncbi:MAG: sn-glycerol-3-phosphate ABC transporter ATP-binding protein UgpC [Planctomycetota bacterium]